MKIRFLLRDHLPKNQWNLIEVDQFKEMKGDREVLQVQEKGPKMTIWKNITEESKNQNPGQDLDPEAEMAIVHQTRKWMN